MRWRVNHPAVGLAAQLLTGPTVEAEDNLVLAVHGPLAGVPQDLRPLLASPAALCSGSMNSWFAHHDRAGPARPGLWSRSSSRPPTAARDRLTCCCAVTTTGSAVPRCTPLAPVPTTGQPPRDRPRPPA